MSSLDAGEVLGERRAPWVGLHVSLRLRLGRGFYGRLVGSGLRRRLVLQRKLAGADLLEGLAERIWVDLLRAAAVDAVGQLEDLDAQPIILAADLSVELDEGLDQALLIAGLQEVREQRSQLGLGDLGISLGRMNLHREQG